MFSLRYEVVGWKLSKTAKNFGVSVHCTQVEMRLSAAVLLGAIIGLNKFGDNSILLYDKNSLMSVHD